MTTLLGINAYHGDASASLVVDGRLIAAVEEERCNRIKHGAGFPAQASKARVFPKLRLWETKLQLQTLACSLPL